MVSVPRGTFPGFWVSVGCLGGDLNTSERQGGTLRTLRMLRKQRAILGEDPPLEHTPSLPVQTLAGYRSCMNHEARPAWAGNRSSTDVDVYLFKSRDRLDRHSVGSPEGNDKASLSPTET